MKVTNHTELSAQLREALLDDNAAFVDALYDPAGIEDADVRKIVEQVAEETKAQLSRIRAKLSATKVEIAEQVRKGSQWITRFVIDDDMKFEITIDDVYERAGGLHTRDLLKFKVR
jgi:5,10-methenyltetrahydromethanopterin hydrogenase